MTVGSVEKTGVHFDRELFSGTLRCGCGRVFPVVRGVPILLEEGRWEFRSGRLLHKGDLAAAAETWSRMWECAQALPGGYFLSEEFFEKDVPLEGRTFAGAAVLDVGMGQGRYVPHILDRGGAAVFGLSIDSNTFDVYARHAASGRFCAVIGDLRRLPLRADAFDVILCSRVLHHVNDIPQRFRDLVSRLKPSGTLCAVIYADVPRLAPFIRAAGLLRAAFRGSKPSLSAPLLLLPSLLLFAVIHTVYVPLRRSPLRRLLPMAESFLYFSRFGFRWLWKMVIVDICSAPSTTYTRREDLEGMLADLAVSRRHCDLQAGAMWNIRLVR